MLQISELKEFFSSFQINQEILLNEMSNDFKLQ